MRTTTARSLYKIITSDIYTLGVTFHSGYEAIAYPWGSPNHEISKGNSQNSPDDASLKYLAKSLQLVAS